MTKKNITINDVASAAGVSKTTVSRYLNGRLDLMSDKTRSRIEKVINLLDYHPSEVARSLKSKKTNTIGVIVSEIQSPFFSAVISGIEEVLFEHGYSAIFMDCDNKIEKEEQYIKELISKDVEGIIINTTSWDNNYLVQLSTQDLPIVLCDRYINNHKFDIATMDNKQMMHDLFDHLQKQGFNRFAFFTEEYKNNSTRTNRIECFLKEIKNRFGYDASRDIYVINENKKCIDAVKDFSKTFGANDIPVIVGVNTVTTFSAYQAINKLGLTIPKQIGICGPDDWSWGDYMSWPDVTSTPVTTIIFKSKDLGKTCAQMLIDRISNPNKQIQEIKLPVEIIQRKSTQRIKEK